MDALFHSAEIRLKVAQGHMAWDNTWMASTLAVHSFAFWRASRRAKILGRYAGMFLASRTMLSKVTMLCRGLGLHKDRQALEAQEFLC